jgi:hypothetical protein
MFVTRKKTQQKPPQKTKKNQCKQVISIYHERKENFIYHIIILISEEALLKLELGNIILK